jgi:hypothetical protein
MPAIEPGWDAFSCRCRHLHQHVLAVRLASPSSRRKPPRLGHRRAVPARSRHVRIRACVRVGRDALAQACTPARAHLNPGGEAGPLALLFRRTSSSPTSPPAPPWPSRGGLPRSRGRRGGSADPLTSESVFHHHPPFPCAYEPSCGRRVRRHPWRRPKRHRVIRDHPVPGQAGPITPSGTRTPALAFTCTSHASSGRREVPVPAPPPRRRRHARAGADHPTNAVALLCATHRASNPRGDRGATVRSPDARRCGILPPSRLCPAAVTLRRIPSNTLSCPQKPQETFIHRGLHAGVTATDPLGSDAARHSSPSHTPAHLEPSCTSSPLDPMRLASSGQATARTAGIPSAPAIRGSRAAGPV